VTHTKMHDSDLSLDERIDKAKTRVRAGEAAMRIPCSATDVDVVLTDCSREINELRSQNADLLAALSRAVFYARLRGWAEVPGHELAEVFEQMREAIAKATFQKRKEQ
jgi:hypothetical protein